MDLGIRPATDADFDAVRGIHLERDGNGPRPATVAERDAWRAMMATPNLTLVLAELEGRAVGTASLMVMPNLGYNGAPSAFVEAVVVVPRARRKGIATAMMRHLLDVARGQGCDKVQLLSHKRHVHDGAHRLYEGLGFVAEAEGFRLYLRSAGPQTG